MNNQNEPEFLTPDDVARRLKPVKQELKRLLQTKLGRAWAVLSALWAGYCLLIVPGDVRSYLPQHDIQMLVVNALLWPLVVLALGYTIRWVMRGR